jgi:hypothetical protein
MATSASEKRSSCIFKQESGTNFSEEGTYFFSAIKAEAYNSCRILKMNMVAWTLRLFTHIWIALIPIVIVLLYWKWLPSPGYISELQSDLLTIQ